MKRILHYLLLAAVLLGLPLLCCVLAGYDEVLEGVKNFPPRTEDFGSHPEKLWNFRRPFNWWWFAGFAAFTVGCLYPFLKRGFCAGFGKGRKTAERKGRPFPVWGWSGIALLAASWVVTWNRFEWFAPYQVMLSYFPIWMGYIIVMNALCVWRKGTCPAMERPLAYALTFPVSSLFWWFFEYLNRFVWNWYYLGIENLTAMQYTVYATLCFASVLPAVHATAEFLGTFRFFDDANYSGMAWKPDVRSVPSRIALAALSFAGLSGIVFFPDYAYPLLWISPLMTFVLIQAMLGEESILDGLKEGEWGLVFRFQIASLVCGICWETWNVYALAKWVYAVPWVQRWEIGEMPLMGFAGYLPFGAECAAVTYWVWGGSKARR